MIKDDLYFLKSSYHYDLPEDLIAQYPLNDRSASRLMVLSRETEQIDHLQFSDITKFLKAGDVLVLNSTKVIPARLIGLKDTGARIEVLLLSPKTDNIWVCLVKPGKRMKVGSKVVFSETLYAVVNDLAEEGSRIIEFFPKNDLWEELNEIGNIPLPPYITRQAEDSDKDRYQTVYAKENGSVAAPTAGLHFTNEILESLKSMGVVITEVQLNVGLGTFRPVQMENILDHQMHEELCHVSETTADIVNQAKKENRRIIAVGTTTVRTLESFSDNSFLTHGTKWTNIFIYPGKKVTIIDALITNFHMPESTLLMLVSAFAGYDFIMKAYQTAIQEQYRFFSYGDAMLIL